MNSAFTEYEAKKPKPIIPEASTYGAILTGIILAVVLARRFRK